MRIERTNNRITFGIYKGSRTTSYGSYMWGVYKNYRVEVFNATKNKQKLIYVSDNTLLKWIKSKLIYYHNGIRKITKCNAEM